MAKMNDSTLTTNEHGQRVKGGKRPTTECSCGFWMLFGWDRHYCLGSRYVVTHDGQLVAEVESFGAALVYIRSQKASAIRKQGYYTEAVKDGTTVVGFQVFYDGIPVAGEYFPRTLENAPVIAQRRVEQLRREHTRANRVTGPRETSGITYTTTYDPTAVAEERFIVRIDGRELGRVASNLAAETLVQDYREELLGQDIDLELEVEDGEHADALDYLCGLVGYERAYEAHLRAQFGDHAVELWRKAA